MLCTGLNFTLRVKTGKGYQRVPLMNIRALCLFKDLVYEEDIPLILLIVTSIMILRTVLRVRNPPPPPFERPQNFKKRGKKL